MHETFFVFENADTRLQGRRVQRLRGVAQQLVVALALEQDRDFDAALRRGVKRAAETDTWQKIGVGDQYAVFGIVDGVQLGVQDVVAVCQLPRSKGLRPGRGGSVA